MTRNAFRNFTIALGAAAVVAVAALSPTTASAAGGWHGKHGHHGHHRSHRGFRFGFYGPAYYAAPDCYVVRRVVWTSHGKRYRRVTVCD